MFIVLSACLVRLSGIILSKGRIVTERSDLTQKYNTVELPRFLPEIQSALLLNNLY